MEGSMLNAVLKNANIYTKNGFEYGTLIIENGIISDTFSGGFVPDDAIILDLNGGFIFPGFADVHVHLREPGFSYKETIASGTAAAAIQQNANTAMKRMRRGKPASDLVAGGQLRKTLGSGAAYAFYTLATVLTGKWQ